MFDSTILSAMMSLNLRSINSVMLYFRRECCAEGSKMHLAYPPETAVRVLLFNEKIELLLQGRDRTGSRAGEEKQFRCNLQANCDSGPSTITVIFSSRSLSLLGLFHRAFGVKLRKIYTERQHLVAQTFKVVNRILVTGE